MVRLRQCTFGLAPTVGTLAADTISNGTSYGLDQPTGANAPDAATARAYIPFQLTRRGDRITVGASGNRQPTGAANGRTP